MATHQKWVYTMVKLGPLVRRLTCKLAHKAVLDQNGLAACNACSIVVQGWVQA